MDRTSASSPMISGSVDLAAAHGSTEPAGRAAPACTRRGSLVPSENGGGAGAGSDAYQPIGAFDGVRLETGNTVSQWKYNTPNEPLNGPEFKPGPDSLFMFKNNQCKPECCGASFSCDGGCVCTTPQQRALIAGRGGNRTTPGGDF